eukprot:352026-Chlamydomonas_euryale.AAC.4
MCGTCVDGVDWSWDQEGLPGLQDGNAGLAGSNEAAALATAVSMCRNGPASKERQPDRKTERQHAHKTERQHGRRTTCQTGVLPCGTVARARGSMQPHGRKYGRVRGGLAGGAEWGACMAHRTKGSYLCG